MTKLPEMKSMSTLVGLILQPPVHGTAHLLQNSIYNITYVTL